MSQETMVPRDVRRRLDQFVANPSCDANIRGAIHDIPMLDVARLEGLDPSLGQSPFAIVRGLMFERTLFDKSAQKLRQALIKSKVLGAKDRGFQDFRLSQRGGPMHNLQDAQLAFQELLQGLNSKRPQPTLLASPCIEIPGQTFQPKALFTLDLLIIQFHKKAPIKLQIGAIKTYPDRGGYTDSRELAKSRAQLGMYAHGLQLALEQLGLEKKIEVSKRGFFVLTYPGTNLPSIRPNEDLQWQISHAKNSFEKLACAALEAPDPDKERLHYVLEANISYQESCWQFCERAESCHKTAMEAGDGRILGPEVARLLGAIRLERAMELLDGVNTENDAEREFLERVARLKPTLPGDLEHERG